MVSSLKGTVTILASTLVCLLIRQQDGSILFRLCCVLSIRPSPLMQDPESGSFMS